MRKWIAILLALTVALSLAACGAKEEPQPTENHTPAATALPEETEPAPPEIPEIAGDDLEGQIEAAVMSVLDPLTAQCESIIDGVDSYQAYMDKSGEIAAFYEKVNAVSAELCVQMRAYALTCAENILASGKSADDMYEDMDILYDLIYDDMGDEIYDGIYDGILEDLYDAFYDGALDDQPDDVKYADWSDARFGEYEQWSDTRSDTYEHWSDFRSDVYEFWSDMRTELWSDETEGALKELEDFREDVEKLSGKAESAPAEITADAPEAEGIRPEFQETMDSYEAFFDEYVSFMQEYAESDDPFSMLEDYYDMMQQYTEAMTELRNLDTSDFSTEEMLYYTEVTRRVLEKIEEVA